MPESGLLWRFVAVDKANGYTNAFSTPYQGLINALSTYNK
jgi:hypothetical protein